MLLCLKTPDEHVTDGFDVPDGYSEEDIEQHQRGTARGSEANDVRSPFQHDVDRILYSAEFRALAGKTQVVASDQLGGYHNRLTHSLKVAQIGRRMASLLAAKAQADGSGSAGPDPDLLEAVGLLHDIGHPPFGHIGEHSLRDCVDELYGAKDVAGAALDPPSDGFQGNAQNLRIATYLTARASRRHERGLQLTRAALDGATKYPWHRGSSEAEHANGHWGCYATEDPAVEWMIGGLQQPPASKRDVILRPVEEQIMDWADEVTYACHDVEDFYRAGLIPLDRILALPALDNRRRSTQLTYETEQFMAYLGHESPEDIEGTEGHLRGLQNELFLTPYEGTLADKQASAGATSRLITLFVSEARLVATDDTGNLTRYGARLDVPEDHRAKVKLLKKLIHCYVIDRPALAGQQHGQRRIVHDLTSWIANEPARLLPADRREEYLEHGDAVRSAADYVSSMTETQALLLHRRMSGVDYGQVTDVF